MVLEPRRNGSHVFGSVAFGAESMVLFLDHVAYEILASPTDDGLAREAESGFVILIELAG